MTTLTKTQRKKNKKAARVALLAGQTLEAGSNSPSAQKESPVAEPKTELKQEVVDKKVPCVFPCRGFGMGYYMAKTFSNRFFGEPNKADLLNDEIATLLLKHYERQIIAYYNKFSDENRTFKSEIERTDAMYAALMPEIMQIPMNSIRPYLEIGDEKEMSMAYYLFFLPAKQLYQLDKSMMAQAMRDSCSEYFSWSIPGRKALRCIFNTCEKVLGKDEFKKMTFTDLGAGTGYWAYWLQNWPKLQYKERSWSGYADVKISVNAVDAGDEYKGMTGFFHPVIKMSADEYCKSGKADNTVLFISWPRKNKQEVFLDAIKYAKSKLLFLITYPQEFEDFDTGYDDFHDELGKLGWKKLYGREKGFDDPAPHMISWPSIGNSTTIWVRK